MMFDPHRLIPNIQTFYGTFVVLAGLLFAIESAVLTTTGVLFVTVPIANVFWASVLPSVWLWMYIFSAILTRSLLSIKTPFRRLINFMDIAEHPIRALGLVAGTVTSGFTFACLVVSIFI
jgi:hypothetical protein